MTISHKFQNNVSEMAIATIQTKLSNLKVMFEYMSSLRTIQIRIPQGWTNKDCFELGTIISNIENTVR